MKRTAIGIFLFLVALAANAQTGAIQGHTYVGGIPAKTQGMNSTNYLNGIIPSATVTVYLTGTHNLAIIYADVNNTPLANPFTSNAPTSTDPGGWIFWAAAAQGLDVVMSGGVCPNCYVTPVTLTDIFATQQFGGNLCAAGCAVQSPFTLNGIPVFPYASLNVNLSPAQLATAGSFTYSAMHVDGTSIDFGNDAPAGQAWPNLVSAALPGTPSLTNNAVPGSLWGDINARVFNEEAPVVGDNVFRALSGGPNDVGHASPWLYEQTSGQLIQAAVLWEAIGSAYKCNAASLGSTCNGQTMPSLAANWQSDVVSVSQVVSAAGTCTVTTSGNLIAAGQVEQLYGFTGGNAVLNGVNGVVSATGLGTTSYQIPCSVSAGTYTGSGSTVSYLKPNFLESNTNAAAQDFGYATSQVNGAGFTNQSIYVFYEMCDQCQGTFTIFDVKGGNVYQVNAFTTPAIATTNTTFFGGGVNGVGVFQVPYNPNDPPQLRPACNFNADANCKLTITVTSPTGVQNKVGVVVAVGPPIGPGNPVWLLGPTHQLGKQWDQLVNDQQQLSSNVAFLAQSQNLPVYWKPMDRYFFGTGGQGATGFEMWSGTGTSGTDCNPASDVNGYYKHPCKVGHAEMANNVLAASTTPVYAWMPYANLNAARGNPNFQVAPPISAQDTYTWIPAGTSSVTLKCTGGTTASAVQGYGIPLQATGGNLVVTLPQCGYPVRFKICNQSGGFRVGFFPTLTMAASDFALYANQCAEVETTTVKSAGYYTWNLVSGTVVAADGISQQNTLFTFKLNPEAATVATSGVANYTANLATSGQACMFFGISSGTNNSGNMCFQNVAGSGSSSNYMYQQVAGSTKAFSYYGDGHFSVWGPGYVAPTTGNAQFIMNNVDTTSESEVHFQSNAVDAFQAGKNGSGNFTIRDSANANDVILINPSTKLTSIGDGATQSTVDTSGNLSAGSGSNIVYRCVTGGATLPTGSLTTVAAACGSTADTGLRVK